MLLGARLVQGDRGEARHRAAGRPGGEIPQQPGMGGAAIGDPELEAAADPASGFELWITDGSAAHTRLLRDLTPGPAGSAVTGLTPVALDEAGHQPPHHGWGSLDLLG